MARQRNKVESGAEVKTKPEGEVETKSEVDAKNAETVKAVLDQLANTTPAEVETKPEGEVKAGKPVMVLTDEFVGLISGEDFFSVQGVEQTTSADSVEALFRLITKAAVDVKWVHRWTATKNGEEVERSRNCEVAKISLEWDYDDEIFNVFLFDKSGAELYAATVYDSQEQYDAILREEEEKAAREEAELVAALEALRAKKAKK